MDHQPPAGRYILQLIQCGLPLLGSRTASNFLIRIAAVRHKLEFGSLHFNVADEVSPALLFQFTYLRAFENRPIWIGIGAQSTGTFQH